MQSLLSHGCVADEAALGIDVYAELDGRRPRHAVFRRKVISESLGDYRRCAERQVRTVLLTGSDGDDETCVAGNHSLDLHREKLLDAKRRVVRERYDWGMGRWCRRRGVVDCARLKW